MNCREGFRKRSYKSRKDFKILAHKVFCNSEKLSGVILPIAFDNTKEASRLNIQTRISALNFLYSGGAVGIFRYGFNFDNSFWCANGSYLAIFYC